MRRFLLRVLRRSFTYHFFLPLLIFFAVEILSGLISGKIGSFSDMSTYFFSHEKLLGLLTVYITYFAIVALLIRREAAIHVTNIAVLEDILPNATSYFAISTTPLREWFEPGTQVYLSKIVARQFFRPELRHERVLIFFTKADLQSVHATYLDERYARCFKAWHEHFNVRLGFLGPTEIFSLLRSLDLRKRRVLGCYPEWIMWMPDVCLEYFPFWWRRRMRSLAFALVEANTGSRCVVRFSKGRNRLDISTIADVHVMEAYLELVGMIKQKIYRPGTTELARNHDFRAYLG